jgi:hypothetical protein
MVESTMKRGAQKWGNPCTTSASRGKKKQGIPLGLSFAAFCQAPTSNESPILKIMAMDTAIRKHSMHAFTR